MGPRAVPAPPRAAPSDLVAQREQRRRRGAPMVVLAVVAAVVLATAVAACGSAAAPPAGTGTDAVLHGAVRIPALEVGDVAFADVRLGPDVRLGSDVVAGGAPAAGRFHTRAPAGGLLLVYFGYTFCPDVCPTTLTDLSVALRSLGPDAGRVTLAMVTIDPDRDDLDVLSAYLGHFSGRFVAIRPRDAEELDRAESSYLASSSVTRTASGDIEVSHSATVYLVDERGEVRVEWPFGTDADAIAHDLRVVLRDADLQEPEGKT